MKFTDIPQFTRSPSYAVDLPWSILKSSYDNYVNDYGLDVNPDFQRSYVWTLDQKIRYVEFILRGGQTGRNLYANAPWWNNFAKPTTGSFVLVDGKQRLEAVLEFLDDGFKVFDKYLFSSFTERLRLSGPSFRFHVNDLKTRSEVLQWYLDLNTGGTIHTDDELNKVRKLLQAEKNV